MKKKNGDSTGTYLNGCNDKYMKNKNYIYFLGMVVGRVLLARGGVVRRGLLLRGLRRGLLLRALLRALRARVPFRGRRPGVRPKRSELKKLIESPPNFERLGLGYIEADFCK